MSNVIQFLEAMGNNPALNRIWGAEYEAAIALLDITDAQRQALISRDHTALSDSLDGREKTFCTLFIPEEEGSVEGGNSLFVHRAN